MDIREILDKLKVEYLESGHHHARPGWIQIKNCPFCSSENYHLGFNLSGKFFFCWRCRWHYGPKVLQILGMSQRDASAVFPRLDTLPGDDKRHLARGSLVEPAGRGPLLASHQKYLRGRGFNPEEISRVWQVEGIGLAAELKWRLYIPVIQRGKRVSWTTRAIGGRVTQRYISAPAENEEVNIKHCVYGLDYCCQSVVIVEGPLDAWKVGPGAGALFGTAFTPGQVKKLIKVPYRFICFDSSSDAQRRASELADQLAVFPGVTQNILLDAKDPGEATPKELRLIRKVAKL